MTPQLRFPEFSGEWQVKKLGDIAQISSGGTPSRTNPTYWNGDVPWVTTSEINFNIINITNQAITQKGMSNSAAKLFPKGAILIALYGQGKTRGKVAMLGIEATTNQACAAIVPVNSHLNNIFLYQNLSFRYDELRRLSNDGSQKNLSGQLIKSLTFPISQLSEQEKIADFLTAVDDRAQAQQQQVELLKKYKKGVMQKIFTQQIRFKDENGNSYPDWQEKKLGEVFNGEKGSGLSRDDVTESGLNSCILYGELYTKYEEVVENVISRTNSSDGKLSLVNDLLLPCSTTTTGIDLANATALNDANVRLGGDIAILRFRKQGSNIFYAYYLSHFMKTKLAAYGQGSTIVHMYYSHYKNMNIIEPNLAEQEKIADFLTSLDDKIKLEEAKLEQAKNFKKGLLQRMFV